MPDLHGCPDVGLRAEWQRCAGEGRHGFDHHPCRPGCRVASVCGRPEDPRRAQAARRRLVRLVRLRRLWLRRRRLLLRKAIWDVIMWTRKHWQPQRSDDELWLNPTDHGATVLIGCRVLGYEVCASEEVPSGKALIYCRSFSVYVGDGQMPDGRFVLMRLPEMTL